MLNLTLQFGNESSHSQMSLLIRKARCYPGTSSVKVSILDGWGSYPLEHIPLVPATALITLSVATVSGMASSDLTFSSQCLHFRKETLHNI